MADEPDREVPDGAAVFPLIPPELGVHPLLLALMHTVVFLDGSDAQVVDPEAGAEALEYVAGYLQRLDKPQLQRIQEDLDCLTRFARKEGWEKKEIRFLKDFLADFGAEEEGGNE